MKKIALIAAAAFGCVHNFNGAEPPNTQDQQLGALVKEIQMQQAKMAETQGAIDAKLATVGEAVRLARIYASRGGR